MASTSDKARYFLEKSVTELQELQRKKIFSRQEIRSIAQKRSDFEHTLNSRGCQLSDCVRYVEYEMNLESLRCMRARRLRVKTMQHIGRRRICSILDRATRKYYGDIGLWLQYVSYARKHKSFDMVTNILTKLLRLHPTRSDLWVFAATTALEDRGDITEARHLMQRGLRFCKNDRNLWIQYTRLEMINISKLIANSNLNNVDCSFESQVAKTAERPKTAFDTSETPTAIGPILGVSSANPNATHTPFDRCNAANDILSGTIPLAIFDLAMAQFKGDTSLALDFFDAIVAFDIPPRHDILAHILKTIRPTAINDCGVLLRCVQCPLIGLSIWNANFPQRLKSALARLDEVLSDLRSLSVKRAFCLGIYEWLSKYLEAETLDHDVRKVIELTILKLQGAL